MKKSTRERRRERRMTRHYGEPCPDFEPACASCAGWRLFATLGKHPKYWQVREFTDKHQRKERT